MHSMIRGKGQPALVEVGHLRAKQWFYDDTGREGQVLQQSERSTIILRQSQDKVRVVMDDGTFKERTQVTSYFVSKAYVVRPGRAPKNAQ